MEELLKAGSLMLLGPASSGKTTMLRDAALRMAKNRPVPWLGLYGCRVGHSMCSLVGREESVEKIRRPRVS